MARRPLNSATRIAETEEPRVEPVTINYDTTNEQVVIAAALVDSNVRKSLIRQFGNPSAFGHKLHRSMWTVLIAMSARELDFDVATVQSMSDDETAEYALELSQSRPTLPPNLEHHVESLEWDMRRYSVANDSLAELIHLIRDPRTSPERVTRLAKTVSETLSLPAGKQAFYDNEEILATQFAAIEARTKGKAIYPFGLDDLDYDDDGSGILTPRIIPGMAPKHTTLMTGVSGSGKSSVVGRIILEQIRRKRSIAYGAWEMNPGVTLELIAILSLGFSRSKIMTGCMTPEEFNLLKVEMRRLSWWIRFVHVPTITMTGKSPRYFGNTDAVNKLCDWIEESGKDIFVGDLVRKAFSTLDPEQEELALNLFQKRIERGNYHAFFVQQQRLKDIELRPDKRPTREGVKGSSTWIEMADTVLGTHREALWKDVEDRYLELIIMKQRYAKWPIAIQFEWNPEYATLQYGRAIDYKIEVTGEEVDVGYAGRMKRKR